MFQENYSDNRSRMCLCWADEVFWTGEICILVAVSLVPQQPQSENWYVHFNNGQHIKYYVISSSRSPPRHNKSIWCHSKTISCKCRTYRQQGLFQTKSKCSGT